MLFAHVAGDAAQAVHLARVRVREEQADGAQRAIEEPSEARLKRVQAEALAGGDELGLRIQGAQAVQLARVQPVDLVEDHDPRGRAADHVEHVGHGLLAYADLGRVEAGVGHDQHDVGERRLLQGDWRRRPRAGAAACG